MPAERISKKGN